MKSVVLTKRQTEVLWHVAYGVVRHEARSFGHVVRHKFVLTGPQKSMEASIDCDVYQIVLGLKRRKFVRIPDSPSYREPPVVTALGVEYLLNFRSQEDQPF